MFPELIILNLIFWFAPLIWLRSLARNYFTVLALVFSGSYWIPVIFYYDGKISGNVVIEYIRENLIYSLYAAFAFYLGLFIFRRQEILDSLHKYLNLNAVKFKIQKNTLLFVKLTTWMNLIIAFIMAVQHVGVGDRVYFLDEVQAFWYYYLLPLSSVQIAIWIYLDKNSIVRNSIRKDLFLWMAVFAQVFLVGFDGSRRAALLPLFSIIVKVIWFNIIKSKSAFDINSKSMLIALILLFSIFMTLNRAFDVGWGVFDLKLLEYIEYIPVFFQLFLAASPTVHVNTQMLELVSQEGSYGFMNYLLAFGNFLFPKFIFGQYFFGEPLVSALHERFGWYGQDFGFMAEAIYSGGVWGVIVTHFLYGAITVKVMNGYASPKYSIFYKVISVCIVYGAINSLRSDFMNLLKVTFYPAIGFIILYWIVRAFKLIYSRK